MSPAHRRNSLITVRDLIARCNQQAHEHGQVPMPAPTGEPGRHRKPTRERWRGTAAGFERISRIPVTLTALVVLVAAACTPDAPPPPGWVVTDPGGMSTVVPPRVEVSTESPDPTRTPCVVEPSICNPGGGR